MLLGRATVVNVARKRQRGDAQFDAECARKPYAESVHTFGFNLTLRIVRDVTRVARVAAMRHRSTERRQCTLLALTRRGTEKIETKSVHKDMCKKRLQIELQPDAANS